MRQVHETQHLLLAAYTPVPFIRIYAHDYLRLPNIISALAGCWESLLPSTVLPYEGGEEEVGKRAYLSGVTAVAVSEDRSLDDQGIRPVIVTLLLQLISNSPSVT